MRHRDFFKHIVTSLKRHLILRSYRQAAKPQLAVVRQSSSPHIRHFGLRPRQHSEVDTSIH